MTSSSSETARPRAWQRMLSGRRLDLLNPSPDDIAIEDIAHGLARVARWNGQTIGEHAFSVAQHSVLVDDIVAKIAPNQLAVIRQAALLHDAPEYVVGDLISPFKAAIGFDYKTFEERLLEAIHHRFSLPYPLPQDMRDAIKKADRIAAFHEAIALAGFDFNEACQCFGPEPSLPQDLTEHLSGLEAMPVAEAQAAFLSRHVSLLAATKPD
ncbi:MAG: YfbR-like 5'-deoxynucleotidase [Hyphomicrobiaceae bacterium]